MGRLLGGMLFSATGNKKIANIILVSVKLAPFIVMCVWKREQNFLCLLLDRKMKIQHFITVTSVLQILFVFRVIFLVYMTVLARFKYVSSFPDTFSSLRNGTLVYSYMIFSSCKQATPDFTYLMR